MDLQDGIYYLTGIVCDENLQRMLGLASDISQLARSRPNSVNPSRKPNSPRAKDLTKQKPEKLDGLEAHTRDKPHNCNICGRHFTQKSGLLLHKRIHTDNKPFGCRICGKKFTQIGHLNTHKRTHTNDKFYSCDICYKQFETRGNLKTHKMVHVEEHYGLYKCEVCGERFTYSGNLRKHLVEHDVEKRHYCDFCGKQFTQVKKYHNYRNVAGWRLPQIFWAKSCKLWFV